MIKKTSMLAVLLSVTVLFCACESNDSQHNSSTTTTPTSTTPSSSQTTTTTTPSSSSQATTTTKPEPVHSPLYIDGLDVEDVIRYFAEVCLDAEFVNSGDASLIQKWSTPIHYRIIGTPTDKDTEVLTDFANWLNTIDGFPGISETQDPAIANLRIHFCTQQDLIALMGDQFAGTDGAITFWYVDNAIYDAIICYRTDIGQFIRNSVILEEIYNGLGPIQDTNLRQDSIIYSGYSAPQSLTNVDALIMKLLYHPQIQCGMNFSECEEVIRQLYY